MWTELIYESAEFHVKLKVILARIDIPCRGKGLLVNKDSIKLYLTEMNKDLMEMKPSQDRVKYWNSLSVVFSLRITLPQS